MIVAYDVDCMYDMHGMYVRHAWYVRCVRCVLHVLYVRHGMYGVCYMCCTCAINIWIEVGSEPVRAAPFQVQSTKGLYCA